MRPGERLESALLKATGCDRILWLKWLNDDNRPVISTTLPEVDAQILMEIVQQRKPRVLLRMWWGDIKVHSDYVSMDTWNTIVAVAQDPVAVTEYLTDHIEALSEDDDAE